MFERQPNDETPSTLRRVLGAIAALTYLAVLFRTAWISRRRGHYAADGPERHARLRAAFNIAERVQTFTHPLWLGILTAGYFVTWNVFVATFAAT